MSQYWSQSNDVVAWTEHDGPGRPPAGPSPRWYQGLALGFAGWFTLAVVGCELVHHSGGEHIPLSPVEVVGGVTVFLGLPAMVVLLARRHVAGPVLAALLGFLAASVSASQWSLAPWYTALEAGGFAVLGLLGMILAVAQLRSRLAPATPVPFTAGTSAGTAADPASRTGSSPAEASQPAASR